MWGSPASRWHRGSSIWLVITTIALIHIFKKRIVQHRRWMIRSYVFCFTNMLIHAHLRVSPIDRHHLRDQLHAWTLRLDHAAYDCSGSAFESGERKKILEFCNHPALPPQEAEPSHVCGFPAQHQPSFAWPLLIHNAVTLRSPQREPSKEKP